MPSQTESFLYIYYNFYWNLEPGVSFLSKSSFTLSFRFLIKVGLGVWCYPQEVQRREQMITLVILQNIFKVTVQNIRFLQRQLIKGQQIPTGQVKFWASDFRLLSVPSFRSLFFTAFLLLHKQSLLYVHNKILFGLA